MRKFTPSHIPNRDDTIINSNAYAMMNNTPPFTNTGYMTKFTSNADRTVNVKGTPTQRCDACSYRKIYEFDHQEEMKLLTNNQRNISSLLIYLRYKKLSARSQKSKNI